MKKLLTLTAVGIILGGTVNAAYRCLPRFGNLNGIWSGGATDTIMWAAGHNAAYGGPNLLNLVGVSYCSETDPAAAGDSGFGTASISSTTGSNCWCKVISPGNTKWFIGERNIESCADNCATKCAGSFQSYKSYIEWI